MCSGCGVCAGVDPDAFEMFDAPDYGRRPRKKAEPSSGVAIKSCPGVGLSHNEGPDIPHDKFWGPILSVHERCAVDKHVRNIGSSGGLAIALSLYGLESGRVAGVVNSTISDEQPWQNESQICVDRQQIIEAAGSRYSPASPGEALSHHDHGYGPLLFVGKPCDVAGLSKAQKQKAPNSDRVTLKVAFFCAGTPASQGILQLLKKMGVEKPSQVKKLRYRGYGWPGKWFVSYGKPTQEKELSYEESWDYLQKYRQWRCHICPDHSGEFADISVGDPWYKDHKNPQQNPNGSSLVVVRTSVGSKFLADAIRDGYITDLAEDRSLIDKAQPNLMVSRGTLWGRLLALKLARAPTPEYKGFSLFHAWISQLTLLEKIKSIAGAIRRVRSKQLRQRIDRLSQKVNSPLTHATDIKPLKRAKSGSRQ